MGADPLSNRSEWLDTATDDGDLRSLTNVPLGNGLTDACASTGDHHDSPLHRLSSHSGTFLLPCCGR